MCYSKNKNLPLLIPKFAKEDIKDNMSDDRDKPYMLISVYGRTILTERFYSFREAHDAMINEFCKYGKIPPIYVTEEEWECDEEFGYSKWEAYVCDGINHEDYDWLIVNLF